jgi:hypothetical protein
MRPSRILGWILSGGLVLAACGDDDELGDWGPAASVGALCRAHADCATGFCCTSPPCGGMCTYSCRHDVDCPYGTLCADGACFWACTDTLDCAPGYSCKHAHTVCQR